MSFFSEGGLQVWDSQDSMEYWMCKVDGLLRERKQERESPVPTPRRWEEEDLIVQNQEGEIPCLKLA